MSILSTELSVNLSFNIFCHAAQNIWFQGIQKNWQIFKIVTFHCDNMIVTLGKNAYFVALCQGHVVLIQMHFTVLKNSRNYSKILELY